MRLAPTYLPNAAIDKSRWDACVTAAPNGSVYAHSWWLDAMATNWDGIVLGDYTAVMPLPWRRKWGIKYVYQPPLTAQLGVASRAPVDTEGFLAFLKAIPASFRYIDMPLNRDNLFSGGIKGLYPRRNFVLNLHQAYEALQSDYRQNIRRSITKAMREGCKVETGVSLDAILELAQSHLPDADAHRRFKKLFLQLQQQGIAESYGVRHPDKQLLSGAVFVHSHRRAYYLVVGNHADGRKLGVSPLLVDGFIRHHAGTDLLLDFEGSDVPTLAHYYSGFGAVKEVYGALRWNRLPWWVKWLKGR